MKLSEWWNAGLDFVFPAECRYCGNFLGDGRVAMFCGQCWQRITPITARTCALCGDLLPDAPAALRLCRHCRAQPPAMDGVAAATRYEAVAKSAIVYFKFHGAAELGAPLARVICQHLPPTVDLRAYHGILPVPLHPGRRRARGYNQSEILARAIADEHQLPLLRHALRRVRHTSQQTKILQRHARQVNMRGAFRVMNAAEVNEKALILVDDVVTTGATVNECARMLKQAGAASVLVLAIARRVLETA
jgi:ComF family protein